MIATFADQLKSQIEDSPFSREMSIAPAIAGGDPIIVRGIFDESVRSDENRKTTVPVPRILLYQKPAYTPRETQATIGGETFILCRHEIDAELGTLIYLERV